VGSDPVYGAAEFYDMISMLAYAIKKGGYTGEGIRSALLTLRGLANEAQRRLL